MQRYIVETIYRCIERVREVLLRRADRRSIYRRKCVFMSCLGTKTDHVKLDSS